MVMFLFNWQNDKSGDTFLNTIDYQGRKVFIQAPDTDRWHVKEKFSLMFASTSGDDETDYIEQVE